MPQEPVKVRDECNKADIGTLFFGKALVSHVLHADVRPLIPTCFTNEVPETTGVTTNITDTILLICIEVALTIVSHAKGAKTIPQLVVVLLYVDISQGVIGL